MHLVSVGEANAASTLLFSLMEKYVNHHFVITVTTPTGRARVKQLFAMHPNVTICYLPFDTYLMMRSFLKRVNPVISLILETEMWPYFLLNAQQQNIPVVLVNARLSKKSLKGYLKVDKISKEMFTSLDLILAQYKSDKKRLVRLGCQPERIKKIGNIKFDLTIPFEQVKIGKRLKSKLERPVWIAASTHKGEEEQILACHKIIQSQFSNALLILVPRHKERFKDVESLLENQFDYQKYSIIKDKKETISATSSILLGDTLGDMFTYLTLADISFIGGSLVKKGGHNPIEPSSIGLPIITGPHTFNFSRVFKICFEKGFCTKVDDVDALSTRLIALFKNDQQRHELKKIALAFVDENKGATRKVLNALSPYFRHEPQLSTEVTDSLPQQIEASRVMAE